MWEQYPAVLVLGVEAEPARWLGTWVVAAAALLVSLIGRRRLPAGVSPGLFVAGLSGAVLAVGLVMCPQAEGPLWICAVLTALAALWYVVVGWCERRGRASPGDRGAVADAGRLWRDVAAHAVLVCGLLVAGLSLALPAAASFRERLGLSVCLLVLVALSLHFSAGAPGRYAPLGLLACAWRLAGLPAAARVPADAIVIALLVAAVVGLCLALVPILGHWRYRRRVGRSDPERLLDPPAEHRLLWAGVLALAGLVGFGALLVPDRVLTPVAVWLAALAALVAAHRRQSDSAGELGLALVGAGVTLAAVAWLPRFGLNALLGGALAGVYLLWLARFWQQQLNEGRAWTTTGRLIPVARRLGYAGAGLCAVLVVVRGPQPADGAVWLAIVTSAFLLLLWSLLVADAARQDSVPAAFLAGMTLLAALVALRLSVALFGVSVPWPVLAGVAALLLALRVGPARSARPYEGAYNAYIGGALPVLAWYAAVLPGAYQELWFGLAKVITVASLLPALALRWRRGQPE